MDNELKSMLEALLKGQEETNQRLAHLEENVNNLKKDMRTVKHDVKEISWKVDTLYDWTDSLDIKVKDLQDKTAG